MRYLDEFRDPARAERLIAQMRAMVTGKWTIMEVCGGQTHTIVRYGLDSLLPPTVTLVHGPGCPVCVTPTELIDAAIDLAARSEVVLCSFGDMLRVPGSTLDLLRAKAGGGDVRVVYSPLDALRIAESLPDRQVVFFAVGFETTAPTTASTVWLARKRGISNFSLLVAHVRVPPAIETILGSGDGPIDGFLAAGHVCTIMGTEEYEPIARRFRVPIVVTGFEPLDLLHGTYLCLKQLEARRAVVENQYTRSVRPAGNEHARRLMSEVFRVVDRRWRGLDVIPNSGLALRDGYAEFDAERKFDLRLPAVPQPADCLAGAVLMGRLKPPECPAFGSACSPEHPLGAPMVSSEGTCAAYYRFARHPPNRPG